MQAIYQDINLLGNREGYTVHGIRIPVQIPLYCFSVSPLFEKRNATLEEAWNNNPERFPKSGPRYWRHRRAVYLYPSTETRRLIYQKPG